MAHLAPHPSASSLRVPSSSSSSTTSPLQLASHRSHRQTLRFPGTEPLSRDDWRAEESLQGLADAGPAERAPLPRSRSRSASTTSQDGDRFIPTRSNTSAAAFQLLQAPPLPSRTPKRKRPSSAGPVEAFHELEQQRFDRILRGELLPESAKRPRSTPATPAPRSRSPASAVFSFFPTSRTSSTSSLLNLSPLKLQSQEALTCAKGEVRTVERIPFKVLDAPGMCDDFYVQGLAWSKENGLLATALGSSVYTYRLEDGKVSKVCDFPPGNGDDVVTSLCWIHKNALAVGTRMGYIQVWDVETTILLRTLYGHEAKTGALNFSTCNKLLSSGSHDKAILHHDLRLQQHVVSKVLVHDGEVCGLKWSTSEQLASGGNDNRLCIFDGVQQAPIFSLRSAHSAAIKALDWSPHQAHLLASGGGTNDGNIRFWDSRQGQVLEEVKSGSQVCQILWSTNSNELVSAHGFGPEGVPNNRLHVWKYTTRTTQCIASIAGHYRRILHLALSPDGRSVVSGSNDETLRFWNLFPSAKTKQPRSSSILDPTILLR